VLFADACCPITTDTRAVTRLIALFIAAKFSHAEAIAFAADVIIRAEQTVQAV
jgi:hypothetical protein